MTQLWAVPAGSTSGQGSHSSIGFVVVGIIFVIVGLVNAVKPGLNFRMQRWQYKNKQAWEPSRAALVVARFGGCVAVVVGVVLIVVGATR